MSHRDASPTALGDTTIADIYESYRDAEQTGKAVAAARRIEDYLEDGFETARDVLSGYGMDLEDTPRIRYDPDHEGADYSPQRGHTGPLDVGHPKADPIKEHTLLNVLVEEAVHTYHNQVAEDYFEELEHGEDIGDIYNDNCVLKVGYDEALTAPIVHDIMETDEPLDAHMERLSDHYHEADEEVGRQFDAMSSFILDRLDDSRTPQAIEQALGFRDEMLRTGETPF